MKWRTGFKALALGVLMLPALLSGQQGAKINFRDRANNMVLSGFASYAINTDAQGLLTFDGTGSPATGEWSSQDLRIDGAKWAGTARKDPKDAKGAYLLKSVTVSGSVKVFSKQADGEVTLLSPSVRYEAEANRFNLEGPVQVTQVQAKSTLISRSASAVINLFERRPSDQPSIIRMATMTGPVHIKMHSQREVVEGEKKLLRTLTVTADAARMVYDAIARTVTLTGGVKVTGDDVVMAGDATGSRAVIHLDAEGKPVRLEMVGEPGVTNFTERRGGGGR